MITTVSHLKVYVRLHGVISAINIDSIDPDLLELLDNAAYKEGFDNFAHVCETCCGKSLMKFLEAHDTYDTIYAPLRQDMGFSRSISEVSSKLLTIDRCWS